jgi:hypothetical protein
MKVFLFEIKTQVKSAARSFAAWKQRVSAVRTVHVDLHVGTGSWGLTEFAPDACELGALGFGLSFCFGNWLCGWRGTGRRSFSWNVVAL